MVYRNIVYHNSLSDDVSLDRTIMCLPHITGLVNTFIKTKALDGNNRYNIIYTFLGFCIGA